uniref:Transmembrane protein 53 n=1 Tax=Pan paniscus TaxID=9597 RepID=A0A2R9AK42_PANPA
MASAELDYTIEIPDQPCWSQSSQGNARFLAGHLLGRGGCVFCMASCLLLSPLLVDGISAGTEGQLTLRPDWAAQVLTRLGCHLQCITRS